MDGGGCRERWRVMNDRGGEKGGWRGMERVGWRERGGEGWMEGEGWRGLDGVRRPPLIFHILRDVAHFA